MGRGVWWGSGAESNSRCNETILEERESQSSGEEENTEAVLKQAQDEGIRTGLEGIPGMLFRSIPGRIGSYQSDNTESSIFQSETSEEDTTLSINLDDWWQTWTMGRQRKSQADDDNHGTSDLEKVKVITGRMNLSSRRPSTLEWKEKYLDKPPFLWNHVAGKPPILSPSSSDTDLHTAEIVNGPSEWTEERVEKINEAISWIRTELVSKPYAFCLSCFLTRMLNIFSYDKMFSMQFSLIKH